jgi:hypothetical protein
MKKRSVLRQHRQKASERDERINPLDKCAQKERIIKRDNLLTHRKLDAIIQHSLLLEVEEEDRTGDEHSNFSDDDVEGSDLSDPGQTEDTLSLDSPPAQTKRNGISPGPTWNIASFIFGMPRKI